MNADEMKSLLEEVFFEDEYRIAEKNYKKYDVEVICFNLKVYSEKLKRHMIEMVIENYIIGTTICDDVWEMTWSLPKQNYYMKIPGTSTKRNPKDVGDPKAFLMLSKEKLKDILSMRMMNKNLMSDLKGMKENPMEMVRDFKLKNIL
jgi:hypothetical protein